MLARLGGVVVRTLDLRLSIPSYNTAQLFLIGDQILQVNYLGI